jgi:thermitase
MKIQRIRNVARPLIIVCLLLLIAGCSGSSDPVSNRLNGKNSSSFIPSHPILSNVLDITLDDESVLGLGYSYAHVKPKVTHTFKASFLRNISWEWRSDDVKFLSQQSGEGSESTMNFTAENDSTEVSIYLDLTNGNEKTSMRWRIYVAENPVPSAFIHPLYENVVHITDPKTGVISDAVENDLLVTFTEGTSRQDVIRAAFNLECTVLAEIPDLNIYRIHSFDTVRNMVEKEEQFRSLEPVTFIQLNYIRYPDITPNDTYWNDKWDLRIMDADQAWDVETGDNTQVIAIIDTGIDRDHPDLAAKVINGQDFITPAGDGFGGETPGDGADNNGDGMADQNVGHGTHCAGIAAAISNNGVGTTGVAWDTKLIPLRIFPTDGDSGASEDVIYDAYNWLKNNAATNHIIAANMSFGGYGGQTSQEQTVLTQAYNAGVILCAASGNDNYNADYNYPSAYDDVISVAATNSSDVRADFSNYGPSVDVCAPGVQIRSTFYNNTYYDASGTSMASPQVTGLVGLVKARWPSYTQDEVVEQIKFTADNIDSNNPSYIGYLGTGRINCNRAVTQGLTPNIGLVTVFTNEDKIGWSDGNRDRIMNSGEMAEIALRVNNTGLTSASNVTATMTVDNPLVYIAKNTATISGVPRGETVDFTDTFQLIVNRSIPDETDITLSFSLDDDENNGPWEFEKVLTVYKNDMVAENLTVNGVEVGPSSISIDTDDIPLVRIDMTAASNYVIVKNMTLTFIGTALEDSIDEVHLYLDQDGDGEYDGSDFETEIGIRSYYNGSFFGDFDRLSDPHNVPFEQPIDEDMSGHVFDSSRKVTFEDLMIPVTEDETTRVFIVVDVSSTPCPGDTFGVGIASANDIDLMDNDSVTGSFPVGALAREIIPVWDVEQQLTFRENDYTWRAEAAVDSNGYVHVVWDEGNYGSDFNIGYRRSTDQGETWGTESLIDSTDDHLSFFPDIACTDDGIIHIMYYDRPQGVDDRELLYTKSVDGGNNWTTPIQVTNAAGESKMPRLCAEGNIVHIAFHSDRNGNNDIYYFRTENAGNSFTTPVQVNNSAWESEEADIVAKDGNIHICWQDVQKDGNGNVTSGRAMYNYSSNNGVSFGTAQNLSNSVGGNYCYHARVDADATGTAYVVFHSEAAGSFDVYMSHGSGGTMSAAERVTFWDEHGTGMPDIAVDPDGRIDLFYDDTYELVTNVWHQCREAGSSTWSEPVRLSLNFTGDAQIPSVVKDVEKNIYCFWQDFRNETGREEIWYNRMIYGCD